jgi:HEAT repeat protein
MSNSMDKSPVTRGVAGDPDAINSLIAALGDPDGLVRQRARRSLVAIEKPAVPALVKALTDPNDHRRWEAAKALGQIQDPAAAPALVSAMEDQDFGVRWLAAEGLIALGREGLVPLLQALMKHSDSSWLREGAHHVFRMLVDKDLHDLVAPLLKALDDVEPAITIPPAAQNALKVLE